MFNFFKYLVIIIAFTVFAMYVLDNFYTYVYYNGDARNKLQYVTKLGDKKIDYIFIGSSRVENHIDCDLIQQITGKSCLNLGKQGAKLGDGLLMILLLNNYDVKYSKIFYQLDYTSNYYGLEKSTRAQAYPLVKKSGNKELKGILNLSRLYNIPFYGYAKQDKVIGIRELTATLINRKSNVKLANGFVPRYGNSQRTFGELPDFISQPNEELIEMKKNTENKLVLFTAPYCSKDTNRKDFMKSLNKHYPESLNLMDAFDEKTHFFADCGHLNAEGAAAFTKLLIKKLNL